MNERAVDQEKASDRAIIELMLAHQPGGVESRYNRAAYMPRRREIAQAWADLLCVGLVPLDELLGLPRRRPKALEAAHDGRPARRQANRPVRG